MAQRGPHRSSCHFLYRVEPHHQSAGKLDRLFGSRTHDGGGQLPFVERGPASATQRLGRTALGTASAPIPTGTQNTAAAGYTTTQYGPNGTPGNQLINEAAFRIPLPCSANPAANPAYGIGESLECYGNAGAGDLVAVPGTGVLNFDMTFQKAIPLKSEQSSLVFRLELYNAFNHTNFSSWDINPSYDWNNWKNGALVQTNSDLGRYTGAMNPRQMSLSLRLQF